MKGLLHVGMTFLLWISGIHADTFITEVAMKAKPDWVEIYNSGPASIDISGLVLTDLDGTDTPFASQPTTLSPRAYAVIHWSDGTDETDIVGDVSPANGYVDLYVIDNSLTGTDDQAVLLNGRAIVDAVVWSNCDRSGLSGELDDFNALAPEHWIYPEVDNWAAYDSCAWTDSDEIADTESLARYLTPTHDYLDTHRKTDWFRTTHPTPGSRNDQILSIDTERTHQPSSFLLFQNHPNPFNFTTTIRYTLPDIGDTLHNARSKLYHASITICNILGQEIRMLENEPKGPGCYSVSWDGRDTFGHEVTNGIYFYQFVVNGGQWTRTKKMCLLR